MREKQAQASCILAGLAGINRLCLSTQVLVEFHWTVTRKLPEPLSASEARQQIERWMIAARVLPIRARTVIAALQAVERRAWAVWDAQIWAAACLAACPIVLSEDFSHRQSVEGVLFLNPFASDFDIHEVM